LRPLAVRGRAALRRVPRGPADLRRHSAAARGRGARRERAAGVARLARRPDRGAADRVTRGRALVVCLGLAASAAGVDGELPRLPALPAGATRVYLVRHAQALSNLDPVPALGAAELDHLTELGRRQAEAAGRALAGGGATGVLSSPATRATETAAAVSQVL